MYPLQHPSIIVRNKWQQPCFANVGLLLFYYKSVEDLLVFSSF